MEVADYCKLYNLKFLDLSRYKFECLNCGKCCTHAIRDGGDTFYYYDYRGNLTRSSKISVSIYYLEMPFIKSWIKVHVDLDPKIIPQHVSFLRDYKVGFIDQYQFKITSGTMCPYYNSKQKRCTIYPARPSICKTYPVTINHQDMQSTSVQGFCGTIMKEIWRQYPETKVGDPCFIENRRKCLGRAFAKEYPVYLETQYDWIARRTPMFVHSVGPLFLEELEVNPRRIKDYEMLDMSEFVEWMEENVSNKKELEMVQKMKFFNKRGH